jgi:hypothetical protein
MKDYDVYWLSEHLMASTTKLREVEKQKTQEQSISVLQLHCCITQRSVDMV